MRILHVITSLSTGGAEKLMVDILPGLRELGNDVELLIFNGTKTPFYEQIEKMGIKIHHLALGGSVYDPRNIFRLRKFIKNYDVIHTHNTACQLFVPIAKALFGGSAKLVTTEHSTSNRRRDKWYFKPIDAWMYKQYSSIISISEIATNILKSYIPNDNIITVDNGINLAKFSNTTPLSRKELVKDYHDDDCLITMVAGFRVGKDQDCVIKSLTELPDNYKVCLVGDGIRRSELEMLIHDLHLENRVNLLGVRSDIPNILAASDVVVLSSHWEGLSLASVEGMACGHPFLASDVNGLKEVVGGNGVLFPDNDYKTLAKEIKHLMEDRDYYDMIVDRCQTAAKKYDIKNTIRKYNDIYRNIVAK